MKKFTLIFSSALLLCGSLFVKAQDPTTAAPIPTYPASDVISFYSGSLTYPEATALSTLPWGQPATYDFAEAGDQECMIVKDLGWLPIGLAKRQPGVLEKTYLHVEIYCNEETDFQIGFQGYGDGGAETYLPAIKYTTPGKWYGIDYPLSEMTKQGFNLGLTNVIRVGGGAGKTYSSKIYLDNIFAFNGEPTNLWDGGASINDAKGTELTIYPTVVSESFSIITEASVQQVKVYNAVGQQVLSLGNVEDIVNISNLNSGVYLVAVTTDNGASITKKIIKQ